MRGIFANRYFNKLFIGGFGAAIGEQATFIALPWLVLVVSGDAVQVGLTLGLMGLPRALLILFGGSLTDKYSPLTMLAWTRLLSACLLALFAGYLYLGDVSLYAVYIFAFISGILTALMIPASMSILPMVVKPEHLAASNSLTMAAMQFSLFAGPMIAGTILAFYGLNLDERTQVANSPVDYSGFVLVFSLDAMSLFLSFALLRKIPLQGFIKKSGQSALSILKQGFSFLRQKTDVCWLLIYVGVISLFVVGPIMVGLPALVDENFAGNSLAFGTLRASYGAGAMTGSILAVVLFSWLYSRLGMFVLVADGTIGFLLFAFSSAEYYIAHVIVFVIGVLGGMVGIGVFTWLQKTTDKEYMGRVMGFILFASFGLVPVSAYLAGHLVERYSASGMFAGIGLIMLTVAVATLVLNGHMRRLGRAAE